MRTSDEQETEGADATIGGVERLRSGRYLADGFAARTYHQELRRPAAIHWHEFYELFLTVSGSGTHVANGLEAPLVPGTVVLLTPADFHALAPGADGLELLDIGFSAEVLHEEVQELLLATTGWSQVVVEGPEREMLAAEFRRLWVEQDAGLVGSRRIVQGALERILIDFCRRRATDTSAPREVQWGNMQRGVAYLHHHFREPLTLSIVAAQAGLSPHYFSERFHRATKTPFNAFVRALRLRFARSLLQVGELSVTEICHASGFATLSHFEREFKRTYGLSPRALRTQLREIRSTQASRTNRAV